MAGAADTPKLVHIAAEPISFTFIKGQADYMQQRGLALHAIASPGPKLEQFATEENVRPHAVRIHRTITPLRDLVALFKLWRCLRRLRPQIVEAHMSKAGMLGMLAARLAGVPVRIYHNHGMALFSARGPLRWLLRASEKTACACAHRVLTVSPSVREEVIRAGICTQEKIKVLGHGSINGIDGRQRFNPDLVDPAAVAAARARMKLPADALIIGFVGRIFRVKGIDDLVKAWPELSKNPNVHLLFVGDFDDRDAVLPETKRVLQTDPRIHITGFVSDTRPYYMLMDVLVLPSLHEGLPLVLLEAAALCRPVVATRIPGNVDAVRDGVTGTLVPPHDVAAFTSAVQRYLESPELRRTHGQAGRAWVLQAFQPERIREELYQEYMALLQQRGVATVSTELRVPRPAPAMVEPSVAAKTRK